MVVSKPVFFMGAGDGNLLICEYFLVRNAQPRNNDSLAHRNQTAQPKALFPKSHREIGESHAVKPAHRKCRLVPGVKGNNSALRPNQPGTPL